MIPPYYELARIMAMIESHDNSPFELADYCQTNDLDALSFLTRTAYLGIALTQNTTDDCHLHKPVFDHYFAYLLSYAMWIGDKHEKFTSRDLQAFGRRAIEKLPASKFPHSSMSQQVADALRNFYQAESSFELTYKYYGIFSTDVSREKLAERIKDGLLSSRLWASGGWDDSKLLQAMQHINEKFQFPPGWLSEECPAMRDFWNLALIAEITHKFCNWDLLEEVEKFFTVGDKWFILSIILANGADRIRDVVLKGVFRFGLEK